MAENLGALLAGAAECFAARDALEAPGEARAMRFGEFLSAARAVAGKLEAAGIAAHEPVHVRVSNHPLDLAAYLGVWLAGGVVVPLHRSSPEGAAAHVLK
jgi:long-chain acyl-CoA synthetase